MIRLKFVKTHEDAKLPERNNKDSKTGDACYDLFAVGTCIIQPKSDVVVPVGLKVGFIEPGYWLKVEARSGNGFKKGLEPHPGVIDNGYRGDFGVKIFNLSNQEQVIEKGQAVAQFSIQKMYIADFVEEITQEQVDVTTRGEAGFGSSDKK